MTISSREVIRRLEADGWTLDRQKGSHLQFVHPTKPGVVTVVHPAKDYPIGTLKSIERRSGGEAPVREDRNSPLDSPGAGLAL